MWQIKVSLLFLTKYYTIH